MFHKINTSSNIFRRSISVTAGLRSANHYGIARDRVSDTTSVEKSVPIFESNQWKKMIRNNVDLSRYSLDRWNKAFDIFRKYGFSTKQFLDIINTDPTILKSQPERIQDNMECWRGTQFGEWETVQLISKNPELLQFEDEHRIRSKLAFLQTYTTNRKNVWKLLLVAPNLLFESDKQTQLKIDYLNDEMKMDPIDVCKSSTLAHSLDTIRCRHKFLERLGLFIPRSPKIDRLEPNKNPRMNQIMDTDDREFAVKVGKVSLAEWEVFQELFKRELDQEYVYDSDGDLNDGMEKGYSKLKRKKNKIFNK